MCSLETKGFTQSLVFVLNSLSFDLGGTRVSPKPVASAVIQCSSESAVLHIYYL